MVIKTEIEYREMIKYMDSIFNTAKESEILRVCKLIEDYEDKHYNIEGTK